jgi:hypothetical protein
MNNNMGGTHFRRWSGGGRDPAQPAGGWALVDGQHVDPDLAGFATMGFEHLADDVLDGLGDRPGLVSGGGGDVDPGVGDHAREGSL